MLGPGVQYASRFAPIPAEWLRLVWHCIGQNSPFASREFQYDISPNVKLPQILSRKPYAKLCTPQISTISRHQRAHGVSTSPVPSRSPFHPNKLMKLSRRLAALPAPPALEAGGRARQEIRMHEEGNGRIG